MFGQTLAIARNTFLEAIRQPIYLVIVLLGGILQAGNTALSSYSMGYTEDTEVSGDNKLLLDIGLATVLVCATLLAAFTATNVLSREIENKTALTVISKPVGRPLFVLGKYLGISGAISIATIILITFLMWAIRHEVMSTARDSLDGPVILFALLAVGGSLALGIWGNYFYGWVFPSTVVLTLLPASVLCYVASISFSKKWEFQLPSEEFKPQIMIACLCVFIAMLVFNALALACSTRLKQVMTLVVCAGVFMISLMSNYFLGQRAFENERIATIANVEDRPVTPDLSRAGQEIGIILTGPPLQPIGIGTQVYFGPNADGVGLVVARQDEFQGDATRPQDLVDPAMGRALLIRDQDIQMGGEAGGEFQFTLVNANNLPVSRLPESGDHLFLTPTRINAGAFAAWGIIPNLQFFWLVDAISQGHPIPGRYVLLVVIYAAVQTTGLLALATALFQRREVG
ncbi:MAG: ABC transporter permease [Phycisphaerales bacterium]